MTNTKHIGSIKKILVLILIILPWSLIDTDKSSEAKFIDDSTVGYYQTNTCQISLAEVVLKNINNTDVRYTLDNYSSIGCFGKINGLDKSGDGYKVGVGTNILVSFLYQSVLWLIFFSFIPKTKPTVLKYRFLSFSTLCIFVGLHLHGEQDFYKIGSRNFSLDFSLSNYFLLSIFLLLLITFFLTNEIISTRIENILIYLPFFFLIPGTYDSMNLNIYLIIFVLFGLQYLAGNNFSQKDLKYSLIYFFVVIFIWMNNNSNSVLFDVDKIRGFSNTSNSTTSILYWSVMIYLFYLGIKYFINKTDLALNLEKMFSNFLRAGALITLFGVIGSVSAIGNFIIYYLFGLNKNGIVGLESIQGNTWRGMSSSAEAVGEFYSVLFFILFYLIVHKKMNLGIIDYTLIAMNFYGFIRANSFSSFISLIFVMGLLIISMYFSKYRRVFLITAVLIVPILIAGFLKSTDTSYEVANKSIILEGMKYSNLFENELDRNLNVTRFFIDEGDLGTIFLYPENQNKTSRSLNFLIDRYTPTIDIPLIPNPVASVSTFSYVINRSEKWGIFFSKYDPSIQEFIFGYGPLQFVDYFNNFNKENIGGLVLPHSSILDQLLFFGLTGTLILIFVISKNILYSWRKGSIFCYLLILQVINLLKSDSILYAPSFILFLVIILESNRSTGATKN
jgi:hypothetical protein